MCCLVRFGIASRMIHMVEQLMVGVTSQLVVVAGVWARESSKSTVTSWHAVGVGVPIDRLGTGGETEIRAQFAHYPVVSEKCCS